MSWSVPASSNLDFPLLGPFVCVYLLDVLLEHAQLQPLVQSDLPMLPDILETPLMVKDLVHNVQDAVNLQNNSDVTETSAENI